MTVDGVQGYSSSEYFFGQGESIYTFDLKKYAGVDETLVRRFTGWTPRMPMAMSQVRKRPMTTARLHIISVALLYQTYMVVSELL